MKIIKYKPFKGVKGFFLEKDKFGVTKFLRFKDNGKNDFSLKIKDDGYVPKSGLIICNCLSNQIRNRAILEIGTGETAIISIFCSKNGSGKITAVDIDKDTIDWAKINCNINDVENVNAKVSNIYNNVKGKYDLIISNPPQLPTVDGASPHDYGGKDGREILEKIINDSSKYLNKEGCLFLLIFDFLSVNKKFGEKESFFELLKNNGFEPSVVCSKTHIIRKDGKTYEAFNKIKQFYPKFKFTRNSDRDYTHKILVVKAVKTAKN